MNTLSKAQVLALFLGTASATTLTAIQLLNGPGDVAKVPDGQTLTTLSSGTVCSGNADCTAEGEKCGAFQETGKTTQNFCVADKYCGSIGRLNETPWFMPCWATPAAGETATAPDVVDNLAQLNALQGLISKAGMFPFMLGCTDDPCTTGVPHLNLWVSPRFNYQDGWYIELASGKFEEFDKEIDNRCGLNIQCSSVDALDCCATYPDTNNRRCMKKSLSGNPLTVGPATFTPVCLVDAEGGVPENAEDDIAQGALTEASEAVDAFYANQLADAKTNADYENMDDAGKLAFDEAQTANLTKRREFFGELQAAVGYDTEACDLTCKAVFETELLAWAKAKYSTCKLDNKSIACREADKIKKDEATARAGGEGKKNYYSGMTADERAEFGKARKDQVSALESSLAAAWLKDHAPEAGEAGSSCAGELKCTFEGHCCGKSTRQDGAFVNEPLEDVCVDKTTLVFTDDLGRGYNHVCAAKNIMATAAAALVAAYSLM